MELSHTNAQLSRLNGSYQSEMAHREQERLEKDKLLNIIEKQVKQWQMLSTYLVSEAENPRTSLARAKKPPVCQDSLSTLTSREQDIFYLLVDGKSHPEISEILFLSESSVRSYRNRLMKKLEIDSLAGLIKFAIKHNLTELD